jgi:hypothetical protein
MRFRLGEQRSDLWEAHSLIHAALQNNDQTFDTDNERSPHLSFGDVSTDRTLL